MFERTWRRWLTPVPGTPYENLWRTRLTLEAQFLAWLLSVPLSLGFLALRFWGQAVAVGLFAVASLALNRALRRGASLQVVTAASLSMVLFEPFISSRFDAAGKLIIDTAPVDLRAMARDLNSLFSARAQQKSLSLVVVVDTRVAAWVRADALRLRQVLSNLLSNAVKFTARGAATLRISGVERLRFEVRDTGEGISAELLPRLFTSFEQGDPETTRRHGGTGLGLALSRELVALMGGKLEVETTAGNGACFSFELALPRCEAPVSVLAPVVARVAPSLPVLVVDDNPVNVKVACALLARLGVKTEVAHNGLEAVAAVEARDFALVLMDCQMPVMDGLEATRRIRALPPARNAVRIIALTASAMTDELDSCRAAGMNDALSKPVSLATLSRVLNVELQVVAPSADQRALIASR